MGILQLSFRCRWDFPKNISVCNNKTSNKSMTLPTQKYLQQSTLHLQSPLWARPMESLLAIHSNDTPSSQDFTGSDHPPGLGTAEAPQMLCPVLPERIEWEKDSALWTILGPSLGFAEA